MPRHVTAPATSLIGRCAVAASAVAEAWMGRASPGEQWFRDQLSEAWRHPESEPTGRDDRRWNTLPIGIDELTLLAPGTPPLVEAIAAAKYGADGDPWRWLGKRLGLELKATAGWLDEAGRPDAARPIVVPMPSPFLRRWHRGIDHTRLMSIEVAAGIGGSVRPWLSRRWGPPQVGGDRRERAEVGLRMSPSWRWALDRRAGRRRRVDPWRPLLLVDDVLTTGHSLAAAAGILRRLGWRRVHAAVLVAQVVGSGPVVDGLSTDRPPFRGGNWN